VSRTEEVVDDAKVPQPSLVDAKVNVRILLAMLWICHFILWIFGDTFTLLHDMGEPANDTAVQFIAPTTAIALTLIVVFTLVGRPTHVRLANMVLALCTYCSTSASSSTQHRAGSTTSDPSTCCSTC
jgi:hypothetical protein